MGLHIVEHPLLGEALAVLRDRNTGTAEFRAAMRRAAAHLFHEAAAGLPVETGTVETPLGTAAARRVHPGVVTLVPVLRAGMGMVDGILPLVPAARVAVVGARRDEETAVAATYYESVPGAAAGTMAFLLDPMLATGGTAIEVLEVLEEVGMAETLLLAIVAAPEGVRAVRDAFPEVEIFAGALDEGLDERKFILPGLGDAGDRYFGT